MRRIWSGSVDIAAAPADVFAYVIDRRNYHKWFPGIVEMTEADDLPADAVGKRYHELAIDPFNALIEPEPVTTAVDPGHSFTMDVDLAPIDPRFHYVFAACATGTRFTIEVTGRAATPQAFIGRNVMARLLAKRGAEALGRLKVIIEAKPEAMMRSVELRQFGAPEDVLWLNPASPRPTPGPGQLLVKIEAAAVNPIDARRTRGYGAPIFRMKGGANWPITLGSDFAGRIAVAGQNSGFSIGDGVFGCLPVGSRGSHADYVLVTKEHVRALPAGVSSNVAAALPYAWTTAWQAVVGKRHPGSLAGQRLLIIGGAGGVGMAATMLARTLGMIVTSVVRDDARSLVTRFGAHTTLAYDRSEQAPESSADIILDLVGEASVTQYGPALRKGGRWATLVHPTLGLITQHGLFGGLVRTARSKQRLRRAIGAKVDYVAFAPSPAALDALAAALPTIAEHVAISERFDLADAARAYAAVERPGARGKVILTP